VQKLSGPAVKVPPPVLQENGCIDKEYFGMLAAEKGPYITNVPPHFPQDHAGTTESERARERETERGKKERERERLTTLSVPER